MSIYGSLRWHGCVLAPLWAYTTLAIAQQAVTSAPWATFRASDITVDSQRYDQLLLTIEKDTQTKGWSAEVAFTRGSTDVHPPIASVQVSESSIRVTFKPSYLGLRSIEGTLSLASEAVPARRKLLGTLLLADGRRVPFVALDVGDLTRE